MSESEEEVLPSVVYVDEDLDAREDFYIDALKSKFFREVLILEPEPNLDDMIDSLLQLNFEALVSDFRLAEASPIDYDGSQLVETFLSLRKGFPCFIRTSWDSDALSATEDVNRVYSKENEGGGVLRHSFFERVNLQVLRYRSQEKDWCEELESLLSVDRSKLTASQIDRIVELDALIEAHMGADSALAKTTKKSLLDGELFQRQSELLTATEELITEIRATLNGDTT